MIMITITIFYLGLLFCQCCSSLPLLPLTIIEYSPISQNSCTHIYSARTVIYYTDTLSCMYYGRPRNVQKICISKVQMHHTRNRFINYKVSNCIRRMKKGKVETKIEDRV